MNMVLVRRKGYLSLSILGAALLVLLIQANFTPSRAPAAEDLTPPQVTAFSITPTEINTGTEDQLLTLNITLTDDLAGVSTSGDNEGQAYHTQVNMRPLIGTQMVTFGTLNRVSGDDLNGTYTGTTTVSRYAKVGVWQVGVLFLADKIGNFRFLTADELISLVPSASGVSIVNTAEANSVTIEREWSLSTARTSVTFPVNTVVTRQEGGSFAFYRMVTQEFSLEGLPTGDLTGTPVGTVRLGIPGLNLNFSQNVAMALNIDPMYNGYTLLIQSLGENGQSWANEETATVSNGRLNFTVNHATYFSANAVRSRPRGSIKINNNRRFTRSNLVTLSPRAVAQYAPVRRMRLSNDGRKWTRWKRFQRTYNRWDLTNANFGGTSSKGRKFVYLKLKSTAGLINAVRIRDSIIYR